MRRKTEFLYLVVATFLIASAVWIFNGKMYAGLLYLIPPIVIGLAKKYPEIPIFRVLTVNVLPAEDSSVSKVEFSKLRCFAFVKLSLIAIATFGLLIPLVIEGYIGADFENPKNPLTILMLILPFLLLLSLFGTFYNLIKFVVLRWLVNS